MDITITLFGIVSILGSLIFSKQLGGVLLILGILRFTVNGNRGYYLMFAGLLILIVGVDLTANELDSSEVKQPADDLSYSNGQAEITNSEIISFVFRGLPLSKLWTSGMNYLIFSSGLFLLNSNSKSKCLN
ncbi:MAG: hypothetical protein ACXAB4_05380 [Candidatus Hodarchaeales archaeon]